MTSYQQYLQSPHWRQVRQAVMYREKGKCEHCGAKATQVHHVTYPKRYRDIHPDNCKALCDSCHRKDHGIRVEKMQEGQKVVFSFSGKSRTYTIEANLFDGYPWIPLKKVEATLYREDHDNNGHLAETLSRTGRTFDLLAATHVKAEHRRVDDDGETWVRASAAILVVMRSSSQSAQDFCKQLAEYLESNFQPESTGARTELTEHREEISPMALLRQMFKTFEDHDKKIIELKSEVDDVRTEVKNIKTVSDRFMEGVRADGYELTETFLRKHAPDLATRYHSKRFGQYMATRIMERDGFKTDEGWYSAKGMQLSKTVNWDGGVSEKLNTWRTDVMEKLLPIYRTIL